MKNKQVRLTEDGAELLARLKLINALRNQRSEPPLVAGRLAMEGIRPVVEAEEKRLGIVLEPREDGQGNG